MNAARGTISIGGVEHNWDLSGLKIEKRPAERFPVSRTHHPVTDVFHALCRKHLYDRYAPCPLRETRV
jgi:hypothetical protein